MAAHSGGIKHGVRRALAAAGAVLLATVVLHTPLESIDGYFTIVVKQVLQVLPLPASAATESMAVMKLGQDEFEGSPFNGEQPLNRCGLRAALEALLARDPPLATVAIDFDLSPAERAADGDCQRELDKLLVAPPNASRLVLLAPFPVADARQREAIRVWMQTMAASKVSFGHGELVHSHGLTYQYPATAVSPYGPTDGQPLQAFGQLLARKMAADRQPAAAATQPTPPTRVDKFVPDPPKPIAFTDVLRMPQRGADVQLFAVDRLDPRVRHVLVGGGYTSDDRHLTPLGELDGVDIHAAIATRPEAWSLSKQVKLLLEWVLALFVIGPPLHSVWTTNLQRRGAFARAHARDPVRSAAGEVLAGLKASLHSAACALPVMATVLLLTLGLTVASILFEALVVAPLNAGGLVLGMLLDAALASGDSAVHLLEHAAAAPVASTPSSAGQSGVVVPLPTAGGEVQRPLPEVAVKPPVDRTGT